MQYDAIGRGEDKELISIKTEDENNAMFSGEEMVSITLHNHMGLNHAPFSLSLTAGGRRSFNYC